MQQNYVKFSLPRGTYIHANVLREAVAKGMDGQVFEQKPEMFNYVSEKQTAPDRPKNRFIGGKGWVGFISESDPMLPAMVIAPAIKHLIEQGLEAGTFIGEAKKSAIVTSEPLVYRLTGLVDQRDKRREAETGKTETVEQLVKRHILAMFEVAFNEGVMTAPVDERDLDIQVVESRRSGETIEFRNGGKKSVAKIRATFMMRADLEGVWQAGHLQSRGYGLLYRVNNGGVTQCPI